MPNLRPASDTGLDSVSLVVIGDFLAERFDELRAFWPGTHKAHIATKNIDELGYLIEMQLSNNSSYTGRSSIILFGPNRTCLLLGIQKHRPEFQQLKGFAVFSYSLLFE